VNIRSWLIEWQEWELTIKSTDYVSSTYTRAIHLLLVPLPCERRYGKTEWSNERGMRETIEKSKTPKESGHLQIYDGLQNTLPTLQPIDKAEKLAPSI
jgi:hypothetical protein